MQTNNEDGAPNLTPLLDLVLQLIMFFMITINFVQVDQLSKDVKLPVAQAATILDQSAEDWIFLNMDKDGKLLGTIEKLNTEGDLRAFLQRQRERLEREAKARGKYDLDIVVVLRADKDVPYTEVWQVLDNCARAGYRRWQLRVKKVG